MTSLGSLGIARLVTRKSLPLVFGLLCASCVMPLTDFSEVADVEDTTPTESPTRSRAQRLDWGAFGDLSHLEISFHDADTNAIVYVTGPYELIYWDDEQIDLRGNLYPDAGDARLTLMQRDDEVWAHLRVLDAEYLTRVE